MHVAHDEVDLTNVDLNLISAFDALAREKSVTRAAARMGITQSAMSHALRRLRDLLGDPIFVRGKEGMVLTPRGAALETPLRSALLTMGRALREPAGWDPRTARRGFCLASPDIFDLVAVPPLLESLRREAPSVDVAIAPLDFERLATKLETGEIDIAIVPRIEGAEASTEATGLVQRTLFHDVFVCFLRKRHPDAKKLGLARFTELSHALVSPTGEGPGFVDQRLAARGLKRRVALRVPSFLTALAIVARSDLVLTAPRALARLISHEHPAVVVPPPLPLPKHAVNLVWHERFTNDAGHRWFRERVAEVAQAAVAS